LSPRVYSLVYCCSRGTVFVRAAALGHLNAHNRGGSRGALEPGPPPLFLVKSILFFTLYTMSENIFLKLNLDFIVAEIRGDFGSVGVYACVCESKSWPLLFFVLQRPNFE